MLDRINADLKQAMLARDERRKVTLSGLKAAIRYAEIDGGKELDKEESFKILKKEAKKRRESMAMYEKAGDDERFAKEQAELEIIESYLPEEASEADVMSVVEAAINEVGASSMQDMGKVMGLAKSRLDNADGALIAKVVKEKLS